MTDPKLINAVAAVFGPDVHISRGYLPEHDGVDIAATLGSLLRAVAPGTVSYARNAEIDPLPKLHWADGGGNVVNIDIPQNRTLQFAHLDSIAVKEGEVVAKGDLIGCVGETGLATGPHVHFGLWKHGTKPMIDPTDYLSGLAAQVAPGDRPAIQVPKATLTVVERFETSRHFTVPAGTNLRGFDPARPNRVIKKKTFADESGAAASSIVDITFPGFDPQPVPHGRFILVATGFLKGLYIVASLVVLDPAPVPVGVG